MRNIARGFTDEIVVAHKKKRGGLSRPRDQAAVQDHQQQGNGNDADQRGVKNGRRRECAVGFVLERD